MVQSLLFLFVQLAIFAVMYWAWKEDEKIEAEEAEEAEARGESVRGRRR